MTSKGDILGNSMDFPGGGYRRYKSALAELKDPTEAKVFLTSTNKFQYEHIIKKHLLDHHVCTVSYNKDGVPHLQAILTKFQGESDIMQSLSKISSTSASTTTPDMCRVQGWADLPEGLLQSIIPLLGSFLELLAFAGTCRSWRSAFSSYPYKSRFCTLLPPLLVRPHIKVRARHLPPRSDDGHKLRTCQVLDLANLRTGLRCQIPEDTFEMLHFAGSSYGQLICGRGRNCVVVDVFAGAKVLPPQLPSRFSEDTYFFSGMLIAPLTSHNAHLVVCAALKQGSGQRSLLDWPVGSDSWSELRLNDSRIEQIVEFNGQFIALDYHYRLHTLTLAPQLGLQEIATVWWDDMDECPYLRPWLAVCGDMLLIVGHYMTLSFGAPVNYKAFRSTCQLYLQFGWRWRGWRIMCSLLEAT